MTERTLATITVEDDEEGNFFYSLDDGASRVGPFESKDAAVEAASEMIAEAFAKAAKAALFGEKK